MTRLIDRRDFSAETGIQSVFGLPPEKAIEYFQSKGYAFSWDWRDVWQESHAKAFTVAKAMRMDVLTTIRGELDNALKNGMMPRDFQKALEPKLKTLGWWGKHEITDADGVVSSVQLGSPHRLKTIYRQNMQTSMMAGRYKEFIENVGHRPYWQYIAILDGKTRPAHRALHLKVFRYDDPIWKSHFPPNGWACRCRVRALSERDLKAYGLSVSSSDGLLSVEEIGVPGNPSTTAHVTVYTDPKSGARFAPDAGWSYNPGRAAWFPDLDRYDYDIAHQYIKGGLTGPDFKAFYDGVIGGNFPVAVLSPTDMQALGAARQTVLLSSETLADHIEKHPDIGLEDYQKLPDIIENGEVYQQGDVKLIYLWHDGKLYRTAIKTTEDRLENYVVTLFVTTEKTADRQLRNKLERLR